MTARGYVYGDHIDTDRIIPGKYTKTLDKKTLAQHVFEDLDPRLALQIKKGDILIAGENFGCGSSREQAAIAIKASGIALVAAKSFSRIFYRNAINVGLFVMEIKDHMIKENGYFSFDMKKGELLDKQTNRVYKSSKLPPFLLAIVEAGGLCPYLKQHETFQLGRE